LRLEIRQKQKPQAYNRQTDNEDKKKDEGKGTDEESFTLYFLTRGQSLGTKQRQRLGRLRISGRGFHISTLTVRASSLRYPTPPILLKMRNMRAILKIALLSFILALSCNGYGAGEKGVALRRLLFLEFGCPS